MSSGFRKMSKKEREALVKLYNIAHCVAVKGRAFTDFEDLIELEKLHRVKYQSGLYENELGSNNFIKSTAEYFFKLYIYIYIYIMYLCMYTVN